MKRTDYHEKVIETLVKAWSYSRQTAEKLVEKQMWEVENGEKEKADPRIVATTVVTCELMGITTPNPVE